MEIKLEDSTIKEAVVAAIVRSLDDAKREMLIVQAIKKLMDEQPRDAYGTPKRPAPIQEIFETEVYNFARETIREKLASDGAFKERLASIMSAALDKAFSNTNPALIENIVELFTASLKPKERY